MSDAECVRCQHPWNPHAMIAFSGNPADGGIALCPVKGCQCLIVWRWAAYGRPPPNLPPSEVIARLREELQADPPPD